MLKQGCFEFVKSLKASLVEDFDLSHLELVFVTLDSLPDLGDGLFLLRVVWFGLKLDDGYLGLTDRVKFFLKSSLLYFYLASIPVLPSEIIKFGEPVQYKQVRHGHAENVDQYEQKQLQDEDPTKEVLVLGVGTEVGKQRHEDGQVVGNRFVEQNQLVDLLVLVGTQVAFYNEVEQVHVEQA